MDDTANGQPVIIPPATRRTPPSAVALVTCAALPTGTAEEQALVAALARRGVTAQFAVWDDAAVDWAAFRLTVIRTTWDYHYRRAAFVAWTERAATLTELWNPAPTVRWNTHKSYLRDLAAAGIPIVPTVWLAAGSSADLRAILAAHGWATAVIKPAVSADSFATHIVAAAALAEGQAHLDTHLPSRDLMVQPFLTSVRTHGERSLIAIAGNVTHAVLRPPLGGAAALPSAPTPVTPTPDESTLAARVLAALTTPPLYARIDLVRADNGALCLLELELVEPALFLDGAPAALESLAAAIYDRMEPPTPTTVL